MMVYPVLTGAVLIEANGAALNNAGQAEGLRVENAIVVKQIRIGRFRYPYVSGQAWRRWWREVLYTDFCWIPSPITALKKPQQQAFTAGDPIKFAEDDIFGYMIAQKREKTSGTFRRVSPLKNSLLISVLPNVIVRDFGHLSRHQQELEKRLTPISEMQDPLLWESENYTTYLQGVFTISLLDVGRFEVGEMRDLPKDIVNTYANVLQIDANNSRICWLPKKERIKRVQDVIRALGRLRGGAHLTRNLSDVAPVVVLVGFFDGGNAPFQRLFSADENNERVILNLERLKSVLTDYKDRLLKPENDKAIFFGYRPTVLANESEILKTFKEQEPFKDCIEIGGTPQQALERVANALPKIYEMF